MNSPGSANVFFLQVGVYEYVDESTSTVGRSTQLNDDDINLCNDQIYDTALHQLESAMAPKGDAVVIPPTGKIPTEGRPTAPSEVGQQVEDVLPFSVVVFL